MSVTAISAEGEFRVGRALGRSADVLFGNLPKFLILTGIVWLPLLVYQLLFFSPGTPLVGGSVNTGALIRTLIVTWLAAALSVISQAAVLFGAFQQMRGRPFEIGESLGKGLRRFLPLLGTAILVGIGLAIGTMLLIVPGLILATMWYVAIPVCVLETAGPVTSLSRSAELTKGSRWKIFGISILMFLIVAIPAAIIEGVLGFALGATGLAIGNYIVRVGAGAFSAVVAAVVYHDLRTAKEGIDVERITAVFE
jgi:hypothetical protein